MSISTGGTVGLAAGTLDSNFCHTSWQSTLQAFINATTVSFSGGALFTASASTPSSADENKLWAKMDSGENNVLGWYYHNGSTWVPVPIPIGSTAAETALPAISGLTAGTYGDADKHVTATVDAYGRITALSAVTPTPPSSNGMAKAWVRFQGSSGTASSSWQCSVDRQGTGDYRVTTSGTAFTDPPVVVASHSGFAHGTGATQTFTVSPAIKVTSSVDGSNNGLADLTVERSHWDGAESNGDENWDAHLDDSDISVVFFGS